METVTNCVFFVFSKADKFKTSMVRVPCNKLLTYLASSSRTYMLLAGWEVRIGKNCDRGLENAARGRRPGVAFSSPRAQFFSIRTDRPITCLSFFPAVNWLSSGFVYATLSLNRLTRRLLTIRKKSNKRTSEKLRR